jgi:hypothetical protein
MIYFSYILSIITYGIIFWGNSTARDEVFKLQKRAIKIITNSHSSTSCRDLFKELNIPALPSQYILSLAVYVAKNIDNFTTNSDIHSINTRHKSSLYPPLLRLTKYQKRVYYTGIKTYNCLPLKIKELSGNLKNFKKSVKKNSFYKVLFILWKNSLTGLLQMIYRLFIYDS